MHGVFTRPDLEVELARLESRQRVPWMKRTYNRHFDNARTESPKWGSIDNQRRQEEGHLHGPRSALPTGNCHLPLLHFNSVRTATRNLTKQNKNKAKARHKEPPKQTSIAGFLGWGALKAQK